MHVIRHDHNTVQDTHRTVHVLTSFEDKITSRLGKMPSAMGGKSHKYGFVIFLIVRKGPAVFVSSEH